MLFPGAGPRSGDAWLVDARTPLSDVLENRPIYEDALEDESELVREHAGWALGHVRSA